NDLYALGCFVHREADSCLMLAWDQEFTQGSRTEAYRYFDIACELGSASGCVQAAQKIAMLPYGYEGLKATALDYYRRACARGHRYGCWQVGETSAALGIIPEAKRAFKQACLADMPEACTRWRELNEGGLAQNWAQELRSLWERLLHWVRQFSP